jgi:mono/diheme cytochrome c family protein
VQKIGIRFARGSGSHGMRRSVFIVMAILSLSAGGAHAAPLVAGYERFGRQAADEAARVEAGLLLLGELGCVNCHAATGPAVTHLSPKQAPVLDAVGRRLDAAWLAAYLTDPQAVHPGATMPNLLTGLPADRRDRTATALTHFLASTGAFAAGSFPGSENAKADAGAEVYERSGCAACHGSRRDGAASLADQRPLGDLVKKWSPAELDAFLKNPTAIRPAGRMPALPLSDDERQHVVAALMGPLAGATGRYDTVVAFEGRAWRKLVDRLPDTATLGPPAKSGPVTGLDVFALAGAREEIVVELTGFFHAPRTGRYAFHLASDDGSRLTIGEVTVVDHDGIHGHSEAQGTVELAAGVHPIRVAFFEAHGQESLAIDVMPPGGPRTPVTAYVTPQADGKPAVTVKDAAVVSAEFKIDAVLVAEGRAAFTAMGCANCHRLDDAAGGASPVVAAATPAKQLADLAAFDAGCLAERPPAAAAAYGLDASQQASLTAALRWLRSPAATDAPARERVIDRSLTASNCYACHDRDGKGGVLPAVALQDEDGEPVLVEAARDALFAATLAELGDEGRRPPTLTGVGGKLRPEFLGEVLREGGRDRTATMPTRMPKWAAAIADPLAVALAADPIVTCPVPPLAGHDEMEIVEQGRHLVGSKALGCIKCHAFAGDKGQSLGLVDMTRMPARLRHEWFLAYVANPQAFRAGTHMPAAWPDGKTFYPEILDGTAAGQIEAVWRYLGSPKPRPPVGAGQNLIELVPADRPIIYRNFIENAGPRAIGVGFPEGVHLAWDAEALRLALVWRGAFIDAGRHWSGRGQGWQPPLGDGVFTPDVAAAVETLPGATASWPSEPPRSRGARFLGYTLDAVGRPTFRWTIDGMSIDEKFDPIQIGKARFLRRTIRLAGRPSEGTAIFRAAAGRLEDAGDGWWRVDGLWKLRLSGAGAGEPVRHDADGRTELRLPVVWNADGSAEIVEELTW